MLGDTKTMNLKRLVNQCIRRDLFYFPEDLPSTETLGTVYGGHSVLTAVVEETPVVYSFGVGEDISFDLEMMKRFGAKIFACDPTPRAVTFIEGQDLSSDFSFKPVAVSDKNETLEFHPPANPTHVSHSTVQQHTAQEPLRVAAESVASLMHGWGHQEISILKMDIEGAEYAVLEHMMQTGIKPQQILVEYHHFFKDASVKQTRDSVELLKRHGYVIFDIDDRGHNYSFVRKSALGSLPS